MSTKHKPTLPDEKLFNTWSEAAKKLFNQLVAASNEIHHVSGAGYAQLTETINSPFSQEVLDAVEEIRDSGIPIGLSKGEFLRAISIPHLVNRKVG